MADIRNLDLNLLRALDALLDERSVTRAALRLRLTQPAVSGTLARLRAAFDDPLFVRTQRGLLPTPRAADLAEPLKRVLADAEALVRQPVFDPKTAVGRLSIVASDYAQRLTVTPFVAQLRRAAPGLSVAVRPLEPARVAALFEQGQADLAILPTTLAPPHLHARRLLDDRYVLAMRADHPSASRKPLTIEAFLGLEHALVSPDGGGYRGPVDEALAAMGLSRRVAASVPSFLGLMDLLRASDLVAAVPERLVHVAPDLLACELPVATPGFTMVAAWHARTHLDPGHRWMREQLISAAAGA
ncbi:MAG: LysR family transcriptional regulator [Caulobacterales bacterium]|nr:LysR family transcriptional regulator [Caulobacterales bacterium]